MLEGVKIEPLAIFPNEKGNVMHMLRCHSALFKQFGEVYFSYVNPGHVKGWKKHLKQTQHFAVPLGNIHLILYDDRKDSSTHGEIQEIDFGIQNYCLVKLPPQVWYAFKTNDDEKAMVVNCTDIPHDPHESISLDLDDPSIPYSWEANQL